MTAVASAAGGGSAAAAKAKPKAKHKKHHKPAKKHKKHHKPAKKHKKHKKHHKPAKKPKPVIKEVKVPGPKETVPGPKETVTVPGPKETVPGPEVKVPGGTTVETKTEEGPEEKHLKQIQAEEAALAKPGATPSRTKEPGATAAVESASAIPAAPAFSNEQLDAYSSGNWLTSQGGNSGDRYSLLNEINTSNVSQLKADWMTPLDGSADTTAFGGEAPPSEYQGVLYYATGEGDVFAVSVKSGKILWVHKGEIPSGSSFSVTCCDKDSRGVVLYDGKVYVGLINSAVEALDMKTGKLVWYAEVGFTREGFAVTAAPLVYDGLVYIGPTGSEENVRGFMAAYNAETGALVWKQYNIPGPGEPGHESWPEPKTSTCNICNYTYESGGATTWQAPVVDPETGDIMYPTANASSAFGADYFGKNRAGDNLWTDSVLARAPLTGKLVWGYQMTHHDIWDYDNSTSAVMINTQVGGKPVTGVAEASKNSFAYYLNATTGQPMEGGPDLGIEEKPVPFSKAQETAKTQPIPKMAPVNRQPFNEQEKAEALKAINTAANQAKEGGVPEIEHGGYPCPVNENICPAGQDVFQLWGEFPTPVVDLGQGGNSGDRQGEPAYNPDTNLWYTCASQELEIMDYEVLAERNEIRFATASPKLVGYINAYNMSTGERKWQKELPHECYGGFLTTAGNLLFTVSATGQLIGYNAETGDQVYEFGEELPEGEANEHFKLGDPGLGAGGAAPAIAFEFEGKEHIAVYAGGGTLGSLEAGDYLWQFSLTGEGPTPIPEINPATPGAPYEALARTNQNQLCEAAEKAREHNEPQPDCNGIDGNAEIGGLPGTEKAQKAQ